jgi:hypothetical protein
MCPCLQGAITHDKVLQVQPSSRLKIICHYDFIMHEDPGVDFAFAFRICFPDEVMLKFRM